MFYDKYCELCKRRGISPSAAAIEMGINKGTVSIWKSKGTTPQTAILGKIADYFGVSVDYLLGNEPKEKTPAEADVSFDDFTYALHNETKELSEEKKQELLEMARFFKHQMEKEKGK